MAEIEPWSNIAETVLVIVKNSSPNRLSAVCRPTVGCLSADKWPAVGRQILDNVQAICQLFVGRQLVMCRQHVSNVLVSGRWFTFRFFLDFFKCRSQDV